MSPQQSNGKHPPVTASAETLAIEAKLAELQERHTHALKHDHERQQLREFMAAHSALTRTDLYALAAEMAPKKAKKAVKSSTKTGYTEPKIAAKTKLGKAIRAHRKAKNLSPGQFAGLVGTTVQALHNWESGRTGATAKMLAKIAHVTGRSVEVFQ